MAQPQTLDALITRYRRAGADASLAAADIELEARFQGITYPIFKTVLEALTAKRIPVSDGVVVRTINSVMDEDPALQGKFPRAQGFRVNLIRQLTFDNTPKAQKTGEKFYRKWPLAQAYRVRNPHALSYNVVLSAEEPLASPFTSDSGALVRVKTRTTFTVLSDTSGSWKIDLTVARAIRGSDAQTALRPIVGQMFRAGVTTPANMLEQLGLDGAEPEMQNLYEYEIEIEHAPRGDQKKADIAAVRIKEITSLIDGVLQLANPTYLVEAVYQAEISHVAGFIIEAPALLRRFEHEWGLKKLVPQVIALTKAEYSSLYPPTGYYLLDKADGVRTIASVRDGQLLLLADSLHEYSAPGYVPGSTNNTRARTSTIVDGELVGQGSSMVFYAFDVISLLGTNVSSEGYEVRVTLLEEAVGVLRDFGVDARPKPVVHLTASEPAELKVQFQASVFDKRPYETDGRILVEPGKSYRDTLSYKWKSLWNTTIDFLARRPPPSVLGRPPYVDKPGHELHFLFVGISPSLYNALGLERVPGYRDLFGTKSGSYFPIQFSPSDAPMAYCYQHPTTKPADWEGWTRGIDGKVIELRCSLRGERPAPGGLGVPDWQMVRIREDRTREIKTQQYYGNDFRIAELTWLNYIDPFAESLLWEGPTLGYFAGVKSPMYRPQTAFTSFVKSQRIEAELAHAAWVVDAAIGRGQDFGRYVKAGVRHVVGIDRDRSALSELIRRKFSHAIKERRTKHSRTTLFALHADLTDPFEQTAARVSSIAGFPAQGADALVINLAIHYLADNLINIRNFVALCANLVKIGGLVIVTTMFGQKVHNLLKTYDIGNGESWNARQDNVLKYSIRREYANARLTSAGQKIGVLLPFSNGDYYEEYLVNVDVLQHEFGKRGFAVTGTPTFDNYFKEFQTRNGAMYKLLTPSDFEFLGLYGEILFRREK